MADGGLFDDVERRKVLLASADRLRWQLADGLRGAGFDVVEVGDEADLWAELLCATEDEDNPREPDLVISELDDPLDVLKRVRERGHTPFIVLTGEDELVQARLLDALVLLRPVEVGEVVALARSLT